MNNRALPDYGYVDDRVPPQDFVNNSFNSLNRESFLATKTIFQQKKKQERALKKKAEIQKQLINCSKYSVKRCSLTDSEEDDDSDDLLSHVNCFYNLIKFL